MLILPRAPEAFDYDLDRLQTFIANFKSTDMWKRMLTTVEDSPWHREANVAVHTLMTLEYAKRYFPEDPTDLLQRRHIVLVSLALLFHDTGKPVAETVKESEERGVYRSYANHEQDSARAFEDYTVDHWDQFEGWISKWDAYVITWMIEHHLPYSLKRPEKVAALNSSLATLFLPNGPEVFFNMLKGDTGGRNSDAWETNFANMIEWIGDRQRDLVATDYAAPPDIEPNDPQLVVMIGPSGAGKSSVRSAIEQGYGVFCLDDLRIEFADSNIGLPYSPTSPDRDASEESRNEHRRQVKANYRLAFQYCVDHDSEFKKFTSARLQALFKEFDQILIDNTNTSVKSRKQYITLAKQKGMKTIAYYIPTSLSLLKSRTNTRDDKKLPEEVIVKQFNAVAVPSQGADNEFDVVNIVGHNYGYNIFK